MTNRMLLILALAFAACGPGKEKTAVELDVTKLLGGIAKVENPPRMEGRFLSMILVPDREGVAEAKKQAEVEAKAQAESEAAAGEQKEPAGGETAAGEGD